MEHYKPIDACRVEQLEKELAKATTEIAYLSALIYKLSMYELAKQHPKYQRWVDCAPHVQEMAR